MSELSTDALHMTSPLRVGRRVGRTIYAQLGPEPSDVDPLVATADSPVLAERIVRAVNAAAPVAREDTASPDEAVRSVRCTDCGADVELLDSIPALAPVIDDHQWLGVLCSGSGATVSRPAPAQPTEAPDAQRAAPTRDPEAVQSVFWSLTAMRGEETIPLGVRAKLAELADTLGPVCVELGGGADGGGEDGGPLRSLAAAVAASDEAPDMGLAWLTDYTRAETEDAWSAGTCVLGKCVDRRYPDAVCEHGTDDYRREVVRLRRVVGRIGATNITHLSRQYRTICKRYGRASAEIARLRGENARLRTEEREEVAKLRSKLTAARPHFGVIARLATAAGVSPDSEDPVGAIEAAIRAGREQVTASDEEIVAQYIDPEYLPNWQGMVADLRAGREAEEVTDQDVVDALPVSTVVRDVHTWVWQKAEHNNGERYWRSTSYGARNPEPLNGPTAPVTVLYRAPAPTPAPLTRGEVVKDPADLDCRATVGTIVEDDADDLGALRPHGWVCQRVVAQRSAVVLDFPVTVVRVGTGGGES